jgi:hypothetical protein
VFLHASDPRESRRDHSLKLLTELRECKTQLCVDHGFDLREPKNRSRIGGEYLTHLRVGTPGYEIVAYLARSLRVKTVSRSVPQNVSRIIRRQMKVGTDRTYVFVAFNSDEKILASHDFGDLPQTVRERLRKAINVRIVTAEEGVVALAEAATANAS